MSKLSGVEHNLPYHLSYVGNYGGHAWAFVHLGYVHALEYLHALAKKVNAPVLLIDVLACKITPELNEPLNQILPELKEKPLSMLRKNSIPTEQLASCTITLAFDLNAEHLAVSPKELIQCECVIQLNDRQKEKQPKELNRRGV